MPPLNERSLHRLGTQFGVIGRHQAVALDGNSKDAYDSMLYRGELARVLRGVVRLPGAPVPPEQPAMAAVLRCWPRARVTGPIIPGLFGVEGFDPSSPFTVLVPPGRRVSGVDFPVEVDPWFDEDGAKWGELPIVTPTRNVFDLGPDMNVQRLLSLIDALKWQGRVANRRLREFKERCPGHPGVPIVEALLEAGSLDQESPGERDLAALLQGILPLLEWQVWITPAIRVDALWRDVMMVIEYLGAEVHGYVDGMSAERFAARGPDTARDEAIRSHGYHPEYVSKYDLRYPEATRARLLSVRARLLAKRT